MIHVELVADHGKACTVWDLILYWRSTGAFSDYFGFLYFRLNPYWTRASME
ncbi:unnamed protein product, partial [Adineta ricciae]